MDRMDSGHSVHSIAASNSPRPDPRLNIVDAHSNRSALVLVNNYSNLSGPQLVDQLSNRSTGNGISKVIAARNGNNGHGVRKLPLSKVNSNLSNASHQQFGHKFQAKMSVQKEVSGPHPRFTIGLPSASNRIGQMEENSNLHRHADPGTPEPGDDADIDDIDLSFDSNQMDHLDPMRHKLEGSLDSGDSVQIEEEDQSHDPLAAAAEAAMAMNHDDDQSMDSEQMEGDMNIHNVMMDQFGCAAGSVSISIASTVPRIPRPKSLTSVRGGDVEYSLDGLAMKDMMLVVSPSHNRHHRKQYSLGVQQDIQNCMSVPGASSSRKFKFDGHSDHKKSHSISSLHFRV